jgi:hypothetical protein
MTIKEAVKLGISKLRKPYWNPTAYIELFLTGDGYAGAVVTLHELGTKTQVPFFQIDSGQADWEEVKEK